MTATRLTQKQFAAIARVLSDPRRYSILKEVAGASDPLSCCDLRQAQNVSAATISHHIKELEGAGLIDIVRDGKYARLTFERAVYQAYVNRLAEL